MTTIPDFCGQGCGGGFPSGAWRYFKHTGMQKQQACTCNPWTDPLLQAP